MSAEAERRRRPPLRAPRRLPPSGRRDRTSTAIRSGQEPSLGSGDLFDLAAEPEDEVRLEFLDGRATPLRALSSVTEEPRAPNPWERFMPPDAHAPRKLEVKQGLNRYVWDLRLHDAELLEGTVMWGQASGPRVPPGVYQVRLSVGDQKQSRTLRGAQGPAAAGLRRGTGRPVRPGAQGLGQPDRDPPGGDAHAFRPRAGRGDRRAARRYRRRAGAERKRPRRWRRGWRRSRNC